VQFIECGPGKILTSLIRRIERRPEIHCTALEDPAALAAALATPSPCTGA
jgi:malonyl CoA-acyl carrier protein transacylase